MKFVIIKGLKNEHFFKVLCKVGKSHGKPLWILHGDAQLDG